MKTYKYLVLSFLITVLFSCNVKQTNEKKLEQEKIYKLETQVFDTVTFQMRKPVADQLIKLYSEYTNKYKNDSLTPYYLFKQADLLTQMKQTNKAIKLYEEIYKKHKTFDQRAEALFLEASLYDNVLKNTAMAEIKYKEFIKEFPNHTLRDDAEKSIQFLGKSPEEIVKILEQSADSNKVDSSAVL